MSGRNVLALLLLAVAFLSCAWCVLLRIQRPGPPITPAGDIVDPLTLLPDNQQHKHPLPADVRKAWQAAGAVEGWMGLADKYGFRYMPDGEELLPAFLVEQWRLAALATVPEPDEPFGLEIWRPPITDDDLKDLRRFRNLAVLSLNGTKITGAGLADLAGLEHLQVLGLAETGVNDTTLEPLAAFKELWLVDLSCTRVTEKGHKHLARIPHLRSLRLNEIRNSLDFKDLAQAKHLQRLDLEYTRIGDSHLRDLVPLQHLKSLTLDGRHLSDDGVEALSGHVEMQVLVLDSARLTNHGVEHLSGLINLDRLSLEDTKLTGNGGFNHLARLGKLTALNLARTEVDDTLIKELVQYHKGIRSLSLRYTSVTDAGLDELTQLANLRDLDVTGARGVTNAGVQKLKRSLPVLRGIIAGQTR
jgi:hypothetical protein